MLDMSPAARRRRAQRQQWRDLAFDLLSADPDASKVILAIHWQAGASLPEARRATHDVLKSLRGVGGH